MLTKSILYLTVVLAFISLVADVHSTPVWTKKPKPKTVEQKQALAAKYDKKASKYDKQVKAREKAVENAGNPVTKWIHTERLHQSEIKYNRNRGNRDTVNMFLELGGAAKGKHND